MILHEITFGIDPLHAITFGPNVKFVLGQNKKESLEKPQKKSQDFFIKKSLYDATFWVKNKELDKKIFPYIFPHPLTLDYLDE